MIDLGLKWLVVINCFFKKNIYELYISYKNVYRL